MARKKQKMKTIQKEKVEEEDTDPEEEPVKIILEELTLIFSEFFLVQEQYKNESKH